MVGETRHIDIKKSQHVQQSVRLATAWCLSIPAFKRGPLGLGEEAQLREKTAPLGARTQEERGSISQPGKAKGPLSVPDSLVQGLRAMRLQWEHEGQLALCAALVRGPCPHEHTVPVSPGLAGVEEMGNFSC